MLSNHITQVHLTLECNGWKEGAEREYDKPDRVDTLEWQLLHLGTQITRKI